MSTELEMGVNAGRCIASPQAGHFVHPYERDADLVAEVAQYLQSGIEAGSGAIAIAETVHLDSLRAEWRARGFDVSKPLEAGQLVLLDAAECLERFMLDGAPSASRFEEVIGSLVRAAVDRFGSVVAFGEMVALLSARGLADAAVQLEGFWNVLAARSRFSLYCAYPMSVLGRGDMAESFRHICAAHSHVIGAEGMRAARIEGEQVRLIAELQQQSAALQRELRLRADAEKRLAARERDLADFVENCVVGLHRVGPDGTILWANRAELEMLGYPAEEYIGRNISDFYLDQKLIAGIMERLARGEVLREQPAQIRCKDGSVRHVLVTSNARIEEDGLVSTRCFTRDVSERWLAQEALRERGAVLHLAMQGARMGYWIGDLERGHIRCNQELATLFGLAGPIDWPMDSFISLMHPDDRQGFRAALREAVETRSRVHGEFRVRYELSDWRWFETRGEAVYDERGAPVRLYGICMDVTRRKREEQILIHLAAVVDSADDAIVSKSLDGIVTSWNAGAARLFGYEAAEMIGRPITAIIPPELHHEEAMIIARLRRGERVEHFTTMRIAKDGTSKRVSVSVSPIRDRTGAVVGASKIAREIPQV